MQRQAGELGISDYIVKPFNPVDLVAKIKSILNK
jgi:DNA-binding response OmpR family regulator